jgi:hypothetical protein
MGIPESPDRFVRFEVGDLTVYLARELLDKLEPGADRQRFFLDGYGGFWLIFSRPWLGSAQS